MKLVFNKEYSSEEFQAGKNKEDQPIIMDPPETVPENEEPIITQLEEMVESTLAVGNQFITKNRKKKRNQYNIM